MFKPEKINKQLKQNKTKQTTPMMPLPEFKYQNS